MDERAAEVWGQAPAIYEKLESIVARPKEDAREELLAVLGVTSAPATGSSGDVAAAGVEEFEYSMHTALMKRLESEDEAQLKEVAAMLDAFASVVAELFERAAAPNQPAGETERCKAWWTILMTIAEDVSRLLPIKWLGPLVDDFEISLVRLRAAYLQLAKQRLQEFDQRQDGEEVKPKDPKDAKAADTKRFEDRKRLIGHLGISPNGQLYLTLTSLLKQLSSRLCSSLHAPLRARIALLLENLLAMDHKAIANNQKLRTQEYIQVEDLDLEPEAPALAVNTTDAVTVEPDAEPVPEGEGTPAEAAPEVGSNGAATVTIADGSDEGESKVTVDTAAKSGTEAGSLGSDPAVDFGLYKNFWGLQEVLQHPERLFERRESWGNFHRVLSALLALFIKYPAQDNKGQPWTEPEPQPLRQAPRMRALGMQLDDPGFRQQFLTQVMIAFQALEQDGSSKRDVGGIISRQPDPVRSEFTVLKKLCESALRQTREGFPELLRHVLDRESHWVAWKSAGCREFEHESLEMLSARMTPADILPAEFESPRPTKPHLAQYLNVFLRTLKDPRWRVPPAEPATDEEAVKGMRPHAVRNMCDAYLDRLIDEDKPENGIEEEYKAKKNKVFMWQARRLFCQQYLRAYAQKDTANAPAKTDFMDYVRAVKGKPLVPPGSNEQQQQQHQQQQQVACGTSDPDGKPTVDEVADLEMDAGDEAVQTTTDGAPPVDATSVGDAEADCVADAPDGVQALAGDPAVAVGECLVAEGVPITVADAAPIPPTVDLSIEAIEPPQKKAKK